MNELLIIIGNTVAAACLLGEWSKTVLAADMMFGRSLVPVPQAA